MKIVVSKGNVLSSAGIFAIIFWSLAQMGYAQTRSLNDPTVETYKQSPPPARCSDAWISKQSLNACKALARQGDASAAFTVGEYCEVLEFDGRCAEEFYQLGAERGHAIAQYRLSSLYSSGVIVPKNNARAAHYLEQAANNGLPDAEYTLGLQFEEKSPEIATEWILKAARHGKCEAQCKIAEMYKQGVGVKSNMAQALFWANIWTVQSHGPSHCLDTSMFFGRPGCHSLQKDLEKSLSDDIITVVQNASSNWRPGEVVPLLPAPDKALPPKQSLRIAQARPGSPKISLESKVGDSTRPNAQSGTQEMSVKQDRRAASRGSTDRGSTKSSPKPSDLPSGDLSPQPIAERSLPEIVKAIQPAVLTIVAINQVTGEESVGTGFFVSEYGHAITNYHVVKNTKEVVAKTSNGEICGLYHVAAHDEKNDLIRLIFKSRSKKVSYLNIATTSPEVGERIIVIGSPLGLEQTVSEGIISAIRERSNGSKVLQISAPISPGSSGSPVVNMKGEVVGVATMMIKEGQNLNFAIPAHYLGLLKGKETARMVFQGEEVEIDLSDLPDQTNPTKEIPPPK